MFSAYEIDFGCIGFYNDCSRERSTLLCFVRFKGKKINRNCEMRVNRRNKGT